MSHTLCDMRSLLFDPRTTMLIKGKSARRYPFSEKLM
jgi:hypothetical protein